MDFLGHVHSLLIHGGAGALGQAIISIALATGSNVFTTVSDVSKKRFLMRLFPQLKGKSIRSLTFYLNIRFICETATYSGYLDF